MSEQREAGPDDLRLTARRLREVIRLMPLRLQVESADDLGVLAGVLEGFGVLTLRSLGPPQRTALTRLCESVLAGCSQAHTATDESSRHAAFLDLRQHVVDARHVVERLIESLSLHTSRPLRHEQLSVDEQHRMIGEHEAELKGVRPAELKGRTPASRSAAEMADLYVTAARPGSGDAAPPPVLPAGTIAEHLGSLRADEREEQAAATRMWRQSMGYLWIAVLVALGFFVAGSGSKEALAVHLTVAAVLGVMSSRCRQAYNAHRREQLRFRDMRALLAKDPVVGMRIVELSGEIGPDQEAKLRIVEGWMIDGTGTASAANEGEQDSEVDGLIKDVLARYRQGKAEGQ